MTRLYVYELRQFHPTTFKVCVAMVIIGGLLMIPIALFVGPATPETNPIMVGFVTSVVCCLVIGVTGVVYGTLHWISREPLLGEKK
jgi:hypothetical protein